MSANISIAEGGKGYPFGPVKCLMVEGDNGEFNPWYPDADRALDSLSVNKNGIYRASDRGVYGWNQVSVNVAQSDRVTGRDPETGQEVTVTTDPETGELVETVVPVEIRVIEPPMNPYGVYVDGQTITKDGMVVKAYDANGDEMQTVPIGEVTINPTTAVFDPNTDKGEYTIEDTSVLAHPNDIHLPLITGFLLGYDSDWLEAAITTNAGLLLWINDMSYCFSKTPATAIMVQTIKATGQQSTYTYPTGESVKTRVSGSTAYFTTITGIIQGHERIGTNNIVEFSGGSGERTNYMRDIATILFDGTGRQGSPQTITVSWPRSGDGAVLETTFDILVGPHGGTGDD